MTRLTIDGFKRIYQSSTYEDMQLNFEDIVGRPPTLWEAQWILDGWIPGSLI